MSIAARSLSLSAPGNHVRLPRDTTSEKSLYVAYEFTRHHGERAVETPAAAGAA